MLINRFVCGGLVEGRGLPCECSSSLLSSSVCWLWPLVAVFALLRDRTPAPERSITEGMAARSKHKEDTFSNIGIVQYIAFTKITEGSEVSNVTASPLQDRSWASDGCLHSWAKKWAKPKLAKKYCFNGQQ